MLPTALNHMTASLNSFAELLAMASALGCHGVEVRNDLNQPLFDGSDPVAAGLLARQHGLSILAVAEVKQFNDWSDQKFQEASDLIAIAVACGAGAISLIPRNDGLGMGNGERQANLRVALRELKPLLQSNGLTGLVEPLGFGSCSVRSKAEVVNAIQAVGGENCFKLVHDTFHHCLAGGGPMFPDQTGIVHISGVKNPHLAINELRDADRVLVDSDDRLGNIDQIRKLTEAGYAGPLSFEAFAPQVHTSKKLDRDVARSFDFIQSRLPEMVS